MSCFPFDDEVFLWIYYIQLIHHHLLCHLIPLSFDFFGKITKVIFIIKYASGPGPREVFVFCAMGEYLQLYVLKIIR